MKTTTTTTATLSRLHVRSTYTHTYCRVDIRARYQQLVELLLRWVKLILVHDMYLILVYILYVEVVVVVVVVVVVLTLTHRHNAVRGHRTGSNNSGAENYLRRKTKKL